MEGCRTPPALPLPVTYSRCIRYTVENNTAVIKPGMRDIAPEHSCFTAQ